MHLRLQRFTHSQIVGMVCALATSICPLTIAAEKSRQLVRRVLSETFPPLLDQITNLGNPGRYSLTGDSITLERPGATYRFDGLTLGDQGVMGMVEIENLAGELIGTIQILGLDLSSDRNTLQYSVSVQGPDQKEKPWVEAGSLTGIGADGQARLSRQVASENDGVSQSTTINFSGLDLSQVPTIASDTTASSTCPLIDYDDSGVWIGGGDGIASFVACVAVAVVVVLIVLITCLLFGWWGC